MVNRRIAQDAIFLVAYGGGHVAMLAPVAEALARAGRPFVFLALTTAGSYLEQRGVPCVGYRHMPEAMDAEVQALGHMLMRALPSGGTVPAEETVAYLGLNYRELIREHGPEQAAELYARHGRQAFLPTRLFARWLEALRPSLVVATNSPRSEQAAILAAGQIGLRALCAVDIFALQEVRWIGKPGYADRVCVLNDSVREMFLAHGRSPQEVVVTGNPAFDRLLGAQVRAAGAAMRARKGWDDDRTTLLWASQVEPAVHPFTGAAGDPALPRRIEQVLRTFVRQNPRFRLVVRYHPSEQVPFSPENGVEFSPVTEPLDALLYAVDLVVVTASTVGLEASMAGRPVISVDCSVFTADAPYAAMGISQGVSVPDQLPGALLQWDGVLRQGAGLPTAVAASGGGATATQRVMQVMDSLLAAV